MGKLKRLKYFLNTEKTQKASLKYKTVPQFNNIKRHIYII